MIDTGLRTLLLAQSSITTLAPSQTIEGISTPSIFNEEPPQGANPPFIVIVQTDHDPMVALDGTYGMQMTTFSIDCYANELPAAGTLRTTVGTFLNDYSGAAGASETINAVILQGNSYRKLYAQDGTDTRQRIASASYLIQHTAN